MRKFKAASAQATGPATPSRLSRLADFGPNPGALEGYAYAPADLRPGAPLVVVLHGCTQNAAAYDASSGWSKLADEQGFALLFPQQQRANNPNLCFNWFSGEDIARGSGEAMSIRQMVAAMAKRHGSNPAQVFVTGLSAGGAMAAVMLATYPDVFAGGAVIAGLPFGVAHNVPEAFDRMRGHGLPSSHVLAGAVRSASSHDGPWPTLSVWHGSADQTVDPSNGEALVEQWRALHGAAVTPALTNRVETYPHRVWRDPQGRDVVEEYRITGLGHGTPLDAARNPDETAGPHMLEAAISSTRRIAGFWGISKRAAAAPKRPAEPVKPSPEPARPGVTDRARPAPSASVQATIEDALRKAGLMP